MEIKYPEYDRSLLSLVSSVLAHYGAETRHATLPELDLLLENRYKNVVVMLFDGMGTAILERHLPPDAFLRRMFKTTISSVFPPTTTAATTTVETGLSPIEHGWLGWSLYFDEIDANVDIFPNILSGSEGVPAAVYNVAQRYLPYKSIYEKIREASEGRVRACSISKFSEFHSGSLGEICDTVKELCGGNGDNFIYTYWHQPDCDMHDFGTKDAKVTEDIREIDRLVENLCRSLSDTLVIVTADHGHVDTSWRFLPDYPSVTECLLRAPSVEARAASFFVKEGMKERFEKEFNKAFGDCFLLFSKREVLSKRLFGGGEPHPRAEGFIGDYLAVAVGGTGIDTREATDDVFKAAHAGMTADEMNVPLIAVDCR